jgi:purine-binding chemotaxis protein CheW
MSHISNLLVFIVSGLQCALPLSEIERVVHAVQIQAVPRAPAIVMGLVNVQGRVMPVLNIRKLFRLTDTGISLNNRLIIARAAALPVAMLVDEVAGVYPYSELEITVADELYSDIEFLEGVAKLKDGVLYIYNLDRFFSLELAAEIAPLLAADTLSPPDPSGQQCQP